MVIEPFKNIALVFKTKTKRPTHRGANKQNPNKKQNLGHNTKPQTIFRDKK